MFDIGAFELLVIVIVAVLVIGPKDMPLALRTAGRWIGKVRRVSAHFRSGVDAMIREAELEEMEKKWKAQNEAIMAKTGTAEDYADDQMTGPPAASAEASESDFPAHDDPAPEAEERSTATGKQSKPRRPVPKHEPQLPLGEPEEKG